VVQSYLVKMTIARDNAVANGLQVAVVVGPNYRQADIPGL
jgi:hypothetical protein